MRDEKILNCSRIRCGGNRHVTIGHVDIIPICNETMLLNNYKFYRGYFV